MPKLIIIIGLKGAGKTAIFHQIIRKYSLDGTNKESAPIINYSKKLIGIKGNIYQLINTPDFILYPQTEIEKAIQKHTEAQLKESDLIL